MAPVIPRIVLDADDFKELVAGKTVKLKHIIRSLEKEIALEDIGFLKMLEAIDEAGWL